MSHKKPKTLPKGNYHYLLMAIYEILESEDKTSVTARDIVERMPELSKVDKENYKGLKRVGAGLRWLVGNNLVKIVGMGHKYHYRPTLPKEKYINLVKESYGLT